VGRPEHVPTFASFFPETALEEFDLALRHDPLFPLRVIQHGLETSFVPYGITRELWVIGVAYPVVVTARGSASWPAIREGEAEGRTYSDLRFRPDPPTMTLDDPTDGCETDAGAGELFVGM